MEAWMQQATTAVAVSAPAIAVIPDVVPGRVLHVDGDMLCYWAGGSADSSVNTSRTVALAKIKRMKELSGSASVVLHLTAESSTKGDRRIVATLKPYQGQRSGSKPKNWGYLREFFEGYEGAEFRVKIWATREADDGVALCAAMSAQPIVIATRDKDFRMIPGIHINWMDHSLVTLEPGTWELVVDDVVFGRKWFWLQMLQGDRADNIPGLERWEGKRCGDVTAANLLRGANELLAYELVTTAYHIEYGDTWLDRFSEQAALLWMRTDAASDVGDFLKAIMPEDGYHYESHVEAVDRIKQRIKDAYAETQGFGSSLVQSDKT